MSQWVFLRKIADARSRTSPLRSTSGGRPKGARISTSLTPSPASESFDAGTYPGSGTYFCIECGSQLALHEDDALPDCQRCGARSFRLDSIFESMQGHGRTTAEFAAQAETEPAPWLEEVRAGLAAGSRHLVCKVDGELLDFELGSGWTRIGRSVAADIRLDDPSVSRRHALVVSEPGEALRVLDDRSLNGVLLNGSPVEWGKLQDGDELTVGRYRLFAIEG